MEYLTWSVSPERQRYEWMRLRRSIVLVRLGFLFIAHVACLGICGVAYVCGTFQKYGPSISIGFWSILLIGLVLLLLEFTYAHLCPSTPPKFSIRHNGVTLYGHDGPCAHFGWEQARVLQIENDNRHPEYRSLILSSAHATRWRRRAGQIIIPLPSKNEAVDETHVIAALSSALEESGLTWVSSSDGAIVLTKAA